MLYDETFIEPFDTDFILKGYYAWLFKMVVMK